MATSPQGRRLEPRAAQEPSPPPQPLTLSRRPSLVLTIGLAVVGALGAAAAEPDGAVAAAKNRVNAYTWVQHGCLNEGFNLSTTSPDGFLLGYGALGGACSISTPWNVGTLPGSQGRLTYTAPSGSRIAEWRNLHAEVHGPGNVPVSSEVYVNDPGGEYQVRDWSTSTYNHQDNVTAEHPDGAYSMFFLMRAHAYLTSHSGWFRHANVHGGTIDLNDLERPTLSGVAVDGGSAWSASPGRTVRWTGADNLGSKGIDRYTVKAGSTALYDSGTGGGTTGPKSTSVSIGSLSDGTHNITVVAESGGSGNLGDTVSSPLAVRIDRTAPTLRSLVALPSSIIGDITISLDATDAHSGIKNVTIERAIPGGWEAVHTATSNYEAISLDGTRLEDGSHQLRAVAEDNAGNTRALSMGSVSVRNQPNRTEAGGHLPPVVATPDDKATPGIHPPGQGASNANRGRVERTVVPPPPTTGPQPRDGARLVLDNPEELAAANAGKARVSLRAKRATPLFTVRYPKPSPITIGGRFLQKDGAPISGHPIALVEAGVVRDWARTGTAGQVSFTYRPLRTGALRLRWGGNDGQDPILTSAAVKVIGRLGVNVPKNARGGGVLTVRGRTLPGVRKELVVLERLNTSRCAAWRHVAVDGTVLSGGRRGASNAAPSRCWEVAGKARTGKGGTFRLRDRQLPPLRLASDARPRSYAYAAYVRVRGLNSASRPVRVMVRG